MRIGRSIMADTLQTPLEVRKSKHVNALQQKADAVFIGSIKGTAGQCVRALGRGGDWPAVPSTALGGKRSGDFAKLRASRGTRRRSRILEVL
jgi:hypothetical protein